MERQLTHIDANGNARMVDVSGKAVTSRTAIAAGRIFMSQDCFDMVAQGRAKKGDVLEVAQVAGIMAAKGASDVIPLCHCLNLTGTAVTFRLLPEDCAIEAVCTVTCDGKNGVEMEALTGVSAALLTIYDKCKAVDRRMAILDIHLLEKYGGKSGDFYFEEERP
ncbi:cyclic pyranopterin monophosphate synthase MoaC [Pseudoflavonifractor sp. 60]|uniref:cyclic pyranopterin monophosphate synthase MoaC n=1 Tax=Pseudoflavonifractor sp. 60 TaxID=2304576 RepID=UPI00136C6F4D|nr:cyclic pyranopterin monophosphate synthase MoaC [Pseudoflavonifractor sp. 60]NBI68450.1 cyclic pyranopterin monophosphate synthase MoaC [Pseudoflavonifractor sp. 60]